MRHAQALLGSDTWAQVLRIRNDRVTDRYPETVYALIFEFAGILWFYTETDGTQSFSRYKNRLEQEKADLEPGLREIDPGFSAFTRLGPEKAAGGVRAALPNGCFIESIVAGWQQLGGGEPILSAQLLLYHVKGLRQGHCVFVYETPRGVFFIDSAAAGRQPQRVAPHRPGSSRQLAARIWGLGPEEAVRVARTVDFPQTGHRPALWASASPQRQGALADPRFPSSG